MWVSILSSSPATVHRSCPRASFRLSRHSATTSESGHYTLLDVPPGQWVMSASIDSYRTRTSVILITSGSNPPVDIGMDAYFTATTHWTLHSDIDPFTDQESKSAGLVGADSNLMLIISCNGGFLAASLHVNRGGGLFHHGYVDIRFDDVPAERIEWSDPDTNLSTPTLEYAESFVESLASHERLLMRATRWRTTAVIDSFDLGRARRAIDYPNCGQSG